MWLWVAGSRGTLRQLRYLATRNLADLLGELELGLQPGAGAGAGAGVGAATEGGWAGEGGAAVEWGGGEAPEHAGPRGEGVGAWRLRLYGDAVLQQHAEVSGGSGDGVLGRREGAGSMGVWR